MDSSTQSSPPSGDQNPYLTLGLEPGASYEQIQAAREFKLAEAGDDIAAKARIEASYDALLMVSLKERQLGKLSNAALDASQKEQQRKGLDANNLAPPFLNNLKNIKLNNTANDNSLLPDLSLADGQGLTIRISLGLLSLVLLLVVPIQSIRLILSLSTLGLFISQVSRGKKLIPSLGWSVVVLSIGLMIGGLIFTSSIASSTIGSNISSAQIQALPAVVLIWIASLIL